MSGNEHPEQQTPEIVCHDTGCERLQHSEPQISEVDYPSRSEIRHLVPVNDHLSAEEKDINVNNELSENPGDNDQ